MGKAKLEPLRNPTQFIILSYLAYERNNAYRLSKAESFPKSYSVAFREIEELFNKGYLMRDEDGNYHTKKRRIYREYENFIQKESTNIEKKLILELMIENYLEFKSLRDLFDFIYKYLYFRNHIENILEKR